MLSLTCICFSTVSQALGLDLSKPAHLPPPHLLPHSLQEILSSLYSLSTEHHSGLDEMQERMDRGGIRRIHLLWHINYLNGHCIKFRHVIIMFILKVLSFDSHLSHCMVAVILRRRRKQQEASEQGKERTEFHNLLLPQETIRPLFFLFKMKIKSNGGEMMSDARLGVLSCSWSGPLKENNSVRRLCVRDSGPPSPFRPNRGSTSGGRLALKREPDNPPELRGASINADILTLLSRTAHLSADCILNH